MKKRTKYNNGRASDSTKIEQSQMNLAIMEWSEGDESLRDAIISCHKNQIPTLASCAGHSITDYPYLAMIMTPQNMEKILNIMNELSEKKGVYISIDLQQITNEEKQECRSILTIHGNMFNKEECFKSIANAAEKSIKPEQTMPIVQSLWNAHKTTRTHISNGQKLYNSISVYNGIIGQRLVVSVNKASDLFNDVIRSTKFKKTIFHNGYNYYINNAIKRKKIIEKINSITQAIKDGMEVNLSDEFFCINSRGEFADKIKVNPSTTEIHQSNIQSKKVNQKKEVEL